MRQPLSILAAVLLATLSTAGGGRAGDGAACVPYPEYFHWEEGAALPPTFGGNVSVDGLVVEGNHLFVTADALHVMDIEDPSHPALLATVPVLGKPGALARAGTRLYVTNDQLGLEIFDVSDPLQPSSSGVFGTAPPTGLAASGSTLFLAAGSYGAYLYDLRDPDNPEQRARILQGGETLRIAAWGWALVAQKEDELSVWDARDPAHPARVAVWTGVPGGFALDGARLYGGLAGGLTIFDLSSAGEVRRLGSLDDGRAYGPIFAAGSQGLAGWSMGTASGVADLSFVDPAHPTARDVGLPLPIKPGSTALGFFRGSRFVLFSTEVGAVAIRPYTRWRGWPLPRLATVQTSVRTLTVRGSHAFGLTIDRLTYVDLSDLSALYPSGNFVIPGSSHLGPAVGRAFIAVSFVIEEGALDVRLFDSHDLADVRPAGSIHLEGPARTVVDLAADSDLLALSTKDGSAGAVFLYAATDPSAPDSQSVLSFPGGAPEAIALQGERLWLRSGSGDDDRELLLYSLADPRTPALLARQPLGRLVYGSTFDGPRAWIRAGRDGGGVELRCYDFTTPETPQLTGTLPINTETGAAPCFVHEGYLYTPAYGEIDGDLDLLVIDVQDPARPVFTAGIPLSDAGALLAVGANAVLTSANGVSLFPAHCTGGTPVGLAALTAAAAPGGIELTWSSGEIEYDGYEVYRGEEHERALLALLPGGTGSTHRYLDRTARAGETCLYWIAGVHFGGQRAWLGPAAGAWPVASPERALLARPNPWSEATKVVWEGPGVPPRWFEVLDSAGRRVYRGDPLTDGAGEEGRRVLLWDGRTTEGRAAAPGVYWIRWPGGGARVVRVDSSR